jgi:CHAD domain-containing protein
MTIDDLLDRPEDEAVRRRALELLDRAVAACGRIDDPADEEAMHDFRVALRRLRALMKLHKDVLGGRLNKLRRRLAEVAALTGEARDAEVQLAWLRARHSKVGPSARAAFDWLCGRLEERKRGGYTLARRCARADLERLAPKLRRRLSRYEVDLEDRSETRTLAAALAERVRAEAGTLFNLLQAVTAPTDEEQAHCARIAGKQLRYLLEPLADSQRAGGEARAAVQGLKKLQDLLGELHDVHVFVHTVEELTLEVTEARLKSGLMAIAAVVRGRRDELFDALLQARERLPDIGTLSSRLRRGVEL